MNRIKKLAEIYANFISLPWRQEAAAAQRVIFCVYNAAEERILRASLPEFEIATNRAGHAWQRFDLSGTFGLWLAAQKYADKYFEKPARLNTMVLEEYLDWLVESFHPAPPDGAAQANLAVALTGVGELFGLLRVKMLVDRLAPKIEGRLVVFFPGSFEGSNYRLLDAYDGWNYHAVPLTADM